MNELEKAWLAGLFEGEGCVCIVGKTDRYKGSPRVIIGMTDEDVITRAANLMGTKVCFVSKNTLNNARHFAFAKKDQYQCMLHGNRALEFMKLFYDLLGLKHRSRIRMVQAAFPNGCAPRGRKPLANLLD
jgi:hypothetical protein